MKPATAPSVQQDPGDIPMTTVLKLGSVCAGMDTECASLEDLECPFEHLFTEGLQNNQ